MTETLIRTPRVGAPEREDSYVDANAPQMGQWYWVGYSGGKGEAAEGVENRNGRRMYLACVVHVGSNFAKVESPHFSDRIHFDLWNATCVLEPEPRKYFERKVEQHRLETGRLLDRVHEVTKMLAISFGPKTLESGADSSVATLAVHTGKALPEYKAALVKAQEKTLPELFEKVKEENKAMATWMKADLIPFKAQADGLAPLVDKIKGRIFNVELYAGLTENAAKIRDGKPADVTEPIHLFQRRHYMDEECLANYAAGGMTFKSIDAFDKWLLRDENFNRIFPFPRCIVAFRVRRNDAQRAFTNWRQFVQFAFSGEGAADKKTFIYIRNGEQLHWLETSIDFGAQLFPDQDHSNLTGKLYANTGSNGARPSQVITENEWLAMQVREKEDAARSRANHAKALLAYRAAKKAYPAKLAAFKREEKKYEHDFRVWKKAKAEWEKKAWIEVPYDAAGERRTVDRRNHDVPEFTLPAPVDPQAREPAEPYKPWRHSPTTYSYLFTPFTKDNVFYDEIAAKIKADIDDHNRLVLLLQGLLDRSMTLHPHPVWRLWEEEGFKAALRLVYDESRALVPGPKPSFEAYRARCNAKIKPGSITVGQDYFWSVVEAERHNAKERRGRHAENHYNLKTYRPRGNPGPGMLAKVVKVRGSKAIFEWTMERVRGRWERSESFSIPGKSGLWTRGVYREDRRKITKHIAVPLDQLFNVSAYEPGDYKQFFADPRTRADYLKWAPFLLVAEDFHAGKEKIAERREFDETELARAVEIEDPAYDDDDDGEESEDD